MSSAAVRLAASMWNSRKHLHTPVYPTKGTHTFLQTKLAFWAASTYRGNSFAFITTAKLQLEKEQELHRVVCIAGSCFCDLCLCQGSLLARNEFWTFAAAMEATGFSSSRPWRNQGTPAQYTKFDVFFCTNIIPKACPGLIPAIILQTMQSLCLECPQLLQRARRTNRYTPHFDSSGSSSVCDFGEARKEPGYTFIKILDLFRNVQNICLFSCPNHNPCMACAGSHWCARPNVKLKERMPKTR